MSRSTEFAGRSVPKTIVVTGASDGIGAAAARLLVRDGHDVIVVGRSEAKTRAVGEELGVPSFVADFARLHHVRALAAQLAEHRPNIDVLVNNAGAILGDRRVTADGFEETFQVNYLAPFLLTNLLLDRLLASGGLVVQTSSNAARLSARVDLDDLNNARNYSPVRAYGNSKLELVLFTRELHDRYHERGLSAVAFHPGGVSSNFARTSRSSVGALFRTPVPRLFFQPPRKAAGHLLRFITPAPGEALVSGAYYENGRPRTVKAPPVASRLWETTAALLGLDEG
ncbi:SDR family NAD(P)-dependent oxidoreductase [Streptomyces griseoaurantiacus]|uniref:SDR family NAD(P)-dependent oxidoreductase n=1 Tax=Streptomyces griseoaurantiacus TaxID=68213 RepID=UPI0036441A88